MDEYTSTNPDGKYTSVYNVYFMPDNILSDTLLLVADKKIKSDSSEEVTVAGRACTKYIKQKTSSRKGETLETWCIDNETGACLAHYLKSDDKFISSFECTKYETGAGVSSYIDTELGKIEFAPLDKSQFLAIGIGSTEDDVPVIDGTFKGAGSDDEGHYSARYSVEGTEEVAKAKVLAYLSAIHDAGAFYDFDVDNDTWEITYFIEPDVNKMVIYISEDFIRFTGFTGTGPDASVNHIEVFGGYEDGAWEIIINTYRF